MSVRCPETTQVTVEAEPLTLRCVIWTPDPDGRHEGDHIIYLPPNLGGEYHWPNTNPLHGEPAP